MFNFFDTETTDRWDFKAPWNADNQPNLIQLGYQIFDKDRVMIKEVDVIVDARKLSTWNGIAEGAAAVHGIDEKRMIAEGVHPEIVANNLVNDMMLCNFTIAHNNEFDMKVLNCFLFRCGYSPTIFEGKTNLCTMKPLTNVLKIKGKYGNKWPSLQEAYCNLVDTKGFEGAHDAMTDVRACRDIFWKALDAGVVKEYEVVKAKLNVQSIS